MIMKSEHDLSKMKSRENPYAAKLTKPVSMKLSEDVVAYFNAMAIDVEVPYQSLINLLSVRLSIAASQVRIGWPVGR
jgi:hypothetical protein